MVLQLTPTPLERELTFCRRCFCMSHHCSLAHFPRVHLLMPLLLSFHHCSLASPPRTSFDALFLDFPPLFAAFFPCLSFRPVTCSIFPVRLQIHNSPLNRWRTARAVQNCTTLRVQFAALARWTDSFRTDAAAWGIVTNPRLC
jgi:hypothetical protein